MPEPISMRLPCPGTVPDGHGGMKVCGVLHVDEGIWATKPHHTHSCQACGMTWRPAVVHTVGVQFLPGFRNDSDFNQCERGQCTPHLTEMCDKHREDYEANCTRQNIELGLDPKTGFAVCKQETPAAESWLWATSRDDERWNGPESSIEACIGEAMAEGLEVFYVAQGQSVSEEDIEGAVGWQLDRILEEAEQHLIENSMVDPEGEADVALWPNEGAAREALMEWASKHIKCKSTWCRVLPETVIEIEPPTVGDLWFDPSEHASAEIFAVSENFVQYFRHLLETVDAPKRFSVPMREWPLAYRIISKRAERNAFHHQCLLEIQSDVARCAYCPICSNEIFQAISDAKVAAAAG